MFYPVPSHPVGDPNKYVRYYTTFSGLPLCSSSSLFSCSNHPIDVTAGGAAKFWEPELQRRGREERGCAACNKYGGHGTGGGGGGRVRRKVLVVRRGPGLRWAAAGSVDAFGVSRNRRRASSMMPLAHKRSNFEGGVVDRTAWVNRYVSIRSTDTRTTIYTLPSFHFLALHEFCESGEPGYRGKKKKKMGGTETMP